MRKSANKDRVHVSPHDLLLLSRPWSPGRASGDSLQRIPFKGKKSGTPLECHVLLLGLLLGGPNVEGQGDLQEKKFFTDNTAHGLIPCGNISLP